MRTTCGRERLRSSPRPAFSFRNCAGSTATRAVTRRCAALSQPLRAAEHAAERATVRFETPPGRQSQIDWGQARVQFRHRPVALHVFVLTLGYCRRSFFEPCLGETLSQFLDAHERAFEYFGGHTQEHLYDRPRTVCQPTGDGRIVWNTTFKRFADYWGFEPHLCRAYRAQTKAQASYCRSFRTCDAH